MVQRPGRRGQARQEDGAGLYTYKDGKPQKKKVKEPADEELRDRLMLPLVNTCVACRREAGVRQR